MLSDLLSPKERSALGHEALLSVRFLLLSPRSHPPSISSTIYSALSSPAIVLPRLADQNNYD